MGDPAQGEGGDAKPEDDWTAVSKPPPRRLAPQHTLSKADLGADSPRNKAAIEISKKKVARFTKDELLAMRKPNSKILDSMADMGEIISEKAMDPVCWEPFDQDEVIRLWQASLQQSRRVPPGGLAVGGNGKGVHRGRDGDDDSNQWRGNNRAEKSLWDDLPGSGGGAAGGVFELSDFAAAAQKFRSDTKDMGLGDHDTPGDQEEDALERLLREQADLDAAEHEAEEANDVPEWADDDLGLGLGIGKSSETFGNAIESTKPSVESEVKRNLLLGALNLKSSALPAPSVPQTQQIFQHEHLLQHQQMQYHQQITDEWWYTDPSGNEQGPFDTANMCAWSLGGYFANDLPIKLKHWTAFHPLCTVFSSQESAFKDMPQEPSRLLSAANLLQPERMVLEQQRQQQLLQQQQLVAEQQRQQQQQLQQLVAEQQRQQLLQQMVAEQQRQQQLQQEQQQQEQQHLQQQQQLQQQLQQQRLLQQNAEHQRLQMQQQQQQHLGPSQQGVSLAAMQQEEGDFLATLRQQQSLHKGPAPWSSGLAAAPFPTFQEIQQDETNRKASADSASASQLKSILGMRSSAQEAKMGWAGAAPGAIGKVAVKPLKEIMQQESLMSSSPEVSRPAINSWAAKIGTGAASVPSTGSSSSSLQPSRAPSNSYQQQPTSPRQQPQAPTKPVPLPVIRDMAPSMVEWCITTMKGIIGSDFDGTGLLEILVSLESPVDIREIISETLGSTPQSSQFATEFIKKKGSRGKGGR